MLPSLLWILSALSMRVLASYYSKSTISEWDSLALIVFYSLYLALFLILKPYFKANLNKFAFFLGGFILLSSAPIMENDQYRYIWEGKVFSKGLNPYKNSPNSKKLDSIDFDKRSEVRFQKYTTIYPPVALSFWGLTLNLDYKYSLILIQLLSLLIVYWIFLQLNVLRARAYLPLFFPLFQQEFIIAVHIDLLAFFFMLLMIKKHLSFGFLSFWSKYTSLLAMPFILLKELEKDKSYRRIILYLFSFILLACLFIAFIYTGFDKTNGAYAFTKYWVWNPGFYSILDRVLGLERDTARYTSIAVFILMYVWHLYSFMMAKLNIDEALLLVFIAMLFFTPVFNTWYIIWALYFALQTGNKWALVYCFLSYWSYFQYGHKEINYISEIISHACYIPALFSILKSPSYDIYSSDSFLSESS
ncbi:MAG: alpha-1,6-mannosyltransferase [Thermoproteota archaeon]|jgi:alpha-1,6-mannosyltransferase